MLRTPKQWVSAQLEAHWFDPMRLPARVALALPKLTTAQYAALADVHGRGLKRKGRSAYQRALERVVSESSTSVEILFESERRSEEQYEQGNPLNHDPLPAPTLRRAIAVDTTTYAEFEDLKHREAAEWKVLRESRARWLVLIQDYSIEIRGSDKEWDW